MFGVHSCWRGRRLRDLEVLEDFSEESFIAGFARNSLPETDEQFHLYSPSPSIRVRNIISSPTQTCKTSSRGSPSPSATLTLDLDSKHVRHTSKHTHGVSSSRINLHLPSTRLSQSLHLISTSLYVPELNKTKGKSARHPENRTRNVQEVLSMRCSWLFWGFGYHCGFLVPSNREIWSTNSSVNSLESRYLQRVVFTSGSTSSPPPPPPQPPPQAHTLTL